MNRRERLEIAMNMMLGMVYAVVWSGSREVEKLTTEVQLLNNGRPGLVLSWVPTSFRPNL
jgi:hypothetical protein